MDARIQGNNSLSQENVNINAGYRPAPSWYFIRAEIEMNSPSRRDGIDLKGETCLRMSYSKFFQDLGIELDVPQPVIATAIVMCHRFFLYQSHAKNDRKLIASACMWLALKMESVSVNFHAFVVFSYQVTNKNDPVVRDKIRKAKVYEVHKDLIILAESLLLRTLDFELNTDVPYKPLMEGLNKFKLPNEEKFRQVAWTFVNDNMRTTLSVQLQPRQVAAAAIFLAAKFLKAKLPLAWVQVFDMTPEKLEDICNQILELYEIEESVANLRGSQDYENSCAGSLNIPKTQSTAMSDNDPEFNVYDPGFNMYDDEGDSSIYSLADSLQIITI